MSKEIVYFNATKKVETISIHYNKKLDEKFVEDIASSIKDIARKMGSKVNLKSPKEYDEIQVYIYPSKQLFNKRFGEQINSRLKKVNFLSMEKRSVLEDMYVVKDEEGAIHIVSPRGMGQVKTDTIKKILVMKVLGEYMSERDKNKELLEEYDN